MNSRPSIVIAGAGPAGLGAAWRLQERGITTWRLFEKNLQPGGLAASHTDDRGFTWDMGGHILFSRSERFNGLVDMLMGDDWIRHERSAWIWMRDRFIPYPLQNNLWKLPDAESNRCLRGLEKASRSRNAASARNFREWILANFGEGLAETFLLPYNTKVWACDPALLGTSWVTDRVATVDITRVRENAATKREDTDWGPNARFRFPLSGGTGAIWRRLCGRLDASRISFGRRLVRVLPDKRIAEFEDGRTVAYDFLVSTIPLDILLRSIDNRRDLARLADGFRHSGAHFVGAGIAGPLPDKLAGMNWIYFPEPQFPFYRVTIFSGYSPHNVPHPGRQWSLLCEVSEAADRPVAADVVCDDVLRGLRAAGLVSAEDSVVSLWHDQVEYAYPTPFLGRDALLEKCDDKLRSLGILSRGRFGGWKYEVGNQDHSLLQGIEAADHIVSGSMETTYSGR